MSPPLPPTSLPFLVTVAGCPPPGPHDMIYQPRLLLYYALPRSPGSAAVPSLSSGAPSPRSSIVADALRILASARTLRSPPPRDDEASQGASAELSAANSTLRESGSRGGRLMRSRVSPAELFREIRLSIYESRSRRLFFPHIRRI